MSQRSSRKRFLCGFDLCLSLRFALGNIEGSGKQNPLFPMGPVIKCILSQGNLCHICHTLKNVTQSFFLSLQVPDFCKYNFFTSLLSR